MNFENLKPGCKYIGDDHFAPIIQGQAITFICHIGFLSDIEAKSFAESEIHRARRNLQLANIWHIHNKPKEIKLC